MLFAVISSAVIFPVSVFCDNLTDTDSSGIVQLFADIYTKWFWVPLIVIAIIWGFSQNDQAKEKYKKSMIVLIVVYVIASKWSTFKATIELISSKFAKPLSSFRLCMFRKLELLPLYFHLLYSIFRFCFHEITNGPLFITSTCSVNYDAPAVFVGAFSKL